MDDFKSTEDRRALCAERAMIAVALIMVWLIYSNLDESAGDNINVVSIHTVLCIQ